MSKKFLIKLFGRSAVNTVVTLVAVGIIFYALFQPKDTTPPSYETSYQLLSAEGQLLYADIDIKQGEKVFVSQVVDGDTIKVVKEDSEFTVRYIGIDTPEIKHQGNGTDENFGQEATRVNEMLVLNKYVYLLGDTAEKDKYGRYLSYVYLEDGIMVNYAIIRMGYATIMTIPPNVAFQAKFLAAQQLAREEKRVLWE